MSISKKPATGTTFAKNVTVSTVADAIETRERSEAQSFDAQFEEAKQLGHVHRFAESNKKATGRTISDHIETVLNAVPTAYRPSLKTVSNRAKEGRNLLDAKPALTLTKARKLREELMSTPGKKVSLRNVIALHTGAKVEEKSTKPKDNEDETENPGNSRTMADAKVPGQLVAATANLSDDPKVAALEYAALAVSVSKQFAGLTHAEFLKMAGLQVIPAKVAAK